MSSLTIGTAQARPCEITYGTFPGPSLPTGSQDDFPVIIAQGLEDGPIMWITSGIHGGEHTGIITIQQLITQDLVQKLHGTVIAVPVLSPGGLRTKQRLPYYSQTDPNRLWPRPDRHRPEGEKRDDKPPSELEEAYQRLFDTMDSTQPACLFDLHNAWFGSIPFAFRDPVFFRKNGAGRSRAEARKLQEQVGEMLAAFGFTIVNEFVADDYVSKNLHRSVSGSVLNGLGIPATTIELGSWMHIDRDVANAAMCGLRNAMRWLGMLPGESIERIEGIPVIRAAAPVRRTVFPYAPKTGIVHHLVRPGEPITRGQPLVRMTDVYGKPLLDNDGVITSEYDGFVIAWHHGIVHYQGDPILDLAIHDDSDLVVPYPD